MAQPCPSSFLLAVRSGHTKLAQAAAALAPPRSSQPLAPRAQLGGFSFGVLAVASLRVSLTASKFDALGEQAQGRAFAL